MTRIVSLLAEAWQELRIHKLRVLLSLIGVGVAVCALTLVVALGAIAERVSTEYMERVGGRPVTLSMYPSQLSNVSEYEVFRDRLDAETERFDISYVTALSEGYGPIAVNGTPYDVNLNAVDPSFKVMRHQVVTAGRWFEAGDEQNMSPPVVVSSNFLDQTGVSAADLPRTITTPTGAQATVIGVVQGGGVMEDPTVFFLPQHMAVMNPDAGFDSLRVDLWVPEHNAKTLEKQLGPALKASLGVQSVERSDFAAQGDMGLGMLKAILLSISGIIMAMGVLGMINIAVVTIQQRIREIGIRRSFGASTGRVFFSVMMESVVGTFVAGVVGVGAAILLLRNPLVAQVLFDGLRDTPPFPVSAALLGIAVALAVGGLAGLIPALVATRIRIIDAIRT